MRTCHAWARAMPSRWAALHEGLEPCRVSHGCVVCLGWDTRGTVLVDASARHASLPETDFTISAWFKTSSPDGAIFSVVRARATESKPMESDREIYMKDGELGLRLVPKSASSPRRSAPAPSSSW